MTDIPSPQNARRTLAAAHKTMTAAEISDHALAVVEHTVLIYGLLHKAMDTCNRVGQTLVTTQRVLLENAEMINEMQELFEMGKSEDARSMLKALAERVYEPEEIPVVGRPDCPTNVYDPLPERRKF